MLDDKKLIAHTSVVSGILEGDGTAPQAERRAAFDNAELPEPLGILINKVATRAHAVAGDDITAVRTSGRTEDEIFELVVCAAVGQATRQYETALASLADALADRPEV